MFTGFVAGIFTDCGLPGIVFKNYIIVVDTGFGIFCTISAFTVAARNIAYFAARTHAIGTLHDDLIFAFFVAVFTIFTYAFGAI